MANVDKGQEGVENLIEARNKYRMLRIRKRQIAGKPGSKRGKQTAHQGNSSKTTLDKL